MKKLLALLLSIMMVFSMAAILSSCGDDDESDDTGTSASDEKDSKKDKKDKKKSDEDLILGQWEMKIDFAKMLNAQMGESDEDSPFDITVDNAEISMFWTFDEDGVCKIEMDQESFKKFYDSYIDKIIDQLTDDPDQKAEFKKQMQDEIQNQDSFETQEGAYKIKKGKLYIEDDDKEESIYTYEFVSDDEIKITDIEGEEDSEMELSTVLPLTLKRK